MPREQTKRRSFKSHKITERRRTKTLRPNDQKNCDLMYELGFEISLIPLHSRKKIINFLNTSYEIQFSTGKALLNFSFAEFVISETRYCNIESDYIN